MYELQILHDDTISNVNYHKPESLNIQADGRVNLIVSDKVTENGGALIYRNKVPAFIFEHEIILKHSQNMRSPCTFIHGDTVCTVIIRSFQI